MNGVSISVCLEDAGGACVSPPRSVGKPFIFVNLDYLALWSTQPDDFRRLASALTEAADTLDAFTQAQNDERARDLGARIKAEVPS